EIRRLQRLGRHVVLEPARLDRTVARRGPDVAVADRLQRRRRLAARRNRARRRYHRAGDAGNRGTAVRGLGIGGGRWSGRGAFDRGRLAAHDRERAVARRVLQADRPACFHEAPSDGGESAAAGCRHVGSGGGGAETGEHLVPGERRVLLRGGLVLPGAGARYFLEASNQSRGDTGNDRGLGYHVLLHGDHATVAAFRVRRDVADRG